MPTPTIPSSPYIEARSKNKLLQMFGKKPPYKHRYQRGYTLYVFGSRTLQCDGCHRFSITPGSLYGYSAANFHYHFLCEECLTLPKDFSVFEVKIKLHRKSKVNPDGIKKWTVVCKVSQMVSWMRQVRMSYPGSGVKCVTDRLYNDAKDDIAKSNRLAYVIKRLWDFFPEIAV